MNSKSHGSYCATNESDYERLFPKKATAFIALRPFSDESDIGGFVQKRTHQIETMNECKLPFRKGTV
jgi:hypothetical protein